MAKAKAKTTKKKKAAPKPVQYRCTRMCYHASRLFYVGDRLTLAADIEAPKYFEKV